MATKSANNAVELGYINYIPANNTLNFTATPISGGAPIVDATAGVYANGAFLQANLAYTAANNALDSWVRNQANGAFLQANSAYTKANSALSNTNLNVSGTLRMLNQGGDEGGEIFLDKAVTNTSLSAGITIDIWQNRLRFFETGGGIRGAFIDIANTTANGVGSEITKYDANNSSTGYISIPIGTTAQRPAAPANGSIRYNTTLGRIEGYLYASGWQGILSDTYNIEYLVIAGGGGGGGATRGGGAGAGGYRSSVIGEYSGRLSAAESVITVGGGTVYTVIVGAGGSSGAYDPNNGAVGGANGSISSFGSITSLGGGGGGSSDSSGTDRTPKSGGSGGGGWYGTAGQPGIEGTIGQGFAGGISGTTGPYGSGGGGAGGAGGNYNSPTGGYGGVGIQSNISGTATYRAGGGSSSGYTVDSNFPGGNGGGGIGRNATGTTVGLAPSNGTNNTGGGGGASGNGGSGVVIIRYPGSQRGTGGTVTSSSGYTIHTFTGSGTFTA